MDLDEYSVIHLSFDLFLDNIALRTINKLSLSISLLLRNIRIYG